MRFGTKTTKGLILFPIKCPILDLNAKEKAITYAKFRGISYVCNQDRELAF